MNVKSTLEPELGQGRLNAIANLLYYNYSYDGDRHEIEEKLGDGMFGYVKLGISLKAFAHHKKYQKECQTFKQYCVDTPRSKDAGILGSPTRHHLTGRSQPSQRANLPQAY